MAEAQLQQFLEKVRQLQAFVALSEADPALRQALRDCDDHHQVVALARSCGFEIGRRWGEQDGHAGGDDNLLSGACPPAGTEETRLLLEGPDLRLERIHSCDFANPENVWYDQDEHEWVVLLRGSATLRFADELQPRQLTAGDSLWISAHRAHRLERTDPAPGSIWLALFSKAACED
ncbi:Nif11 domain/cupin domain-containing protein [Synechococcus sp. CS-1328]|uniref:Nif11 domain/cupin domain-containing protein n=1 Tax=Synechococcus sp. CS-1328 TaxID=2847976 RepID=UPI00223C450A|nr:Nif11 domain/cupin domain-containing protein [Synechococcus sp. CS-1328]MCT0226578.1 Nif11 domain/cupin domain-containing protein [Synechococcus sp. CS-1328]